LGPRLPRQRSICASRPDGRQAESDLSIPDQRRQITAYCLAKGWDIAAEFVEPGNTATDDRRPAFQAMIDAALVKPPTFTVIIVHSFARFFRDQFQFEFYGGAAAAYCDLDDGSFRS
jgi:DNA invertase Pin-like site-specific DNA recombinase